MLGGCNWLVVGGCRCVLLVVGVRCCLLSLIVVWCCMVFDVCCVLCVGC